MMHIVVMLPWVSSIKGKCVLEKYRIVGTASIYKGIYKLF